MENGQLRPMALKVNRFITWENDNLWYFQMVLYKPGGLLYSCNTLISIGADFNHRLYNNSLINIYQASWPNPLDMPPLLKLTISSGIYLYTVPKKKCNFLNLWIHVKLAFLFCSVYYPVERLSFFVINKEQ